MGESADSLTAAAARLVAKGLMHAGDSLSMRLPETEQFARLICGADNTITLHPLGAGSNDMHGQIYAARADVGAVFVGGLTWTQHLVQLDSSLPSVFDEQIRQLGPIAPRVYVDAFGPMPRAALDTGANAFCLNDKTLCLGMGLERLLLNIEILEKCAQSFVLASYTGQKVARVPWLVKFIATRRLRRDQKDTASRHLRGKRSVMKAGY